MVEGHKDYALKGIMTIVPPAPVNGSTYTRTKYVAVTGYSMTAFMTGIAKWRITPS